MKTDKFELFCARHALDRHLTPQGVASGANPFFVYYLFWRM